jgi:hypothetical protein
MAVSPPRGWALPGGGRSVAAHVTGVPCVTSGVASTGDPSGSRTRPGPPHAASCSSRPGSGSTALRPLYVERWMAFAPDGRRVVPQVGDDPQNGAHGARAKRAEVPTHSAGRRTPPRVTKDGQPLGAGGQAALPPHLGRPPPLPRPGDPGAAGNPVRASCGRLARSALAKGRRGGSPDGLGDQEVLPRSTRTGSSRSGPTAGPGSASSDGIRRPH